MRRDGLTDVMAVHGELIGKRSPRTEAAVSCRADVVALRDELVGKKMQRVEAIGDNKVDNMVDSLKRTAEIEIGMFGVTLLGKYADQFLYAFGDPIFPQFGDAFNEIVGRYLVMDGTEQADLFDKISLMFKNIFAAKYPDLGQDKGELISKKYASMMIDQIKARSIQSNTELYPGKFPY